MKLLSTKLRCGCASSTRGAGTHAANSAASEPVSQCNDFVASSGNLAMFTAIRGDSSRMSKMCVTAQSDLTYHNN
jgi:hypothetical protein